MRGAAWGKTLWCSFRDAEILPLEYSQRTETVCGMKHPQNIFWKGKKKFWRAFEISHITHDLQKKRAWKVRSWSFHKVFCLLSGFAGNVGWVCFGVGVWCKEGSGVGGELLSLPHRAQHERSAAKGCASRQRVTVGTESTNCSTKNKPNSARRRAASSPSLQPVRTASPRRQRSPETAAPSPVESTGSSAGSSPKWATTRTSPAGSTPPAKRRWPWPRSSSLPRSHGEASRSFWM